MRTNDSRLVRSAGQLDMNSKPEAFDTTPIQVPVEAARHEHAVHAWPDSPRPPSAFASPPTSPTKRAQRDQNISRDGLSLVLLFNGPGGPSIQNTENTAPPAFFPQQRVSFSPRLRISNKSGLLLGSRSAHATHDREHICSMLLGVTGVVESLSDGRVKSRRILADFCTDLTSGVFIWQRDAEACLAKRRQAQGLSPREPEADGTSTLPAGTYVLPLSMRIPTCDKLPPSYESPHFRLSYTMTLALFSRKGNASFASTPEVVKLASVPFHILPSTLPTLPPVLPVLSHDERRGLGASIMSGLYKSLALASSASTDSLPPPASHVVTPSLPTSHYSPGSIVPLTLRVHSKPLAPHSDLYVRMSLIRKVFVRDSSTSLQEVDDFGMTDEMVLDRYCRSEDVLASRWAWIPSEHRIGKTESDRPLNSEVIMRDITLPLGTGVEGWQHGYSTSLDLPPTARPFLDFAKGSWFSPALQQVVEENAKDAERHLHVSTRFFIAVDVGFATSSTSAPRRLADVFAERKALDPWFDLPAPATFTKPVMGEVDPFSNDLPSSQSAPDLRMQQSKSASSWSGSPMSLSTSIFGGLRSGAGTSFPGTMRHLLLPITIGSVAEPSMQCVTGRWVHDVAMEGSRGSHPADREEIEETPAERAERVGDDGEQSWLVPPPNFTDALKAPPAFV